MTGTTEPINMMRAKCRNRALHGRSSQARTFFNQAWSRLTEAQEQGFLRCQLNQTVPIDYKETKAARDFCKSLKRLGLQFAWVVVALMPDDRRNPFGQHVYFHELRVWWHNGSESLPNIQADKPCEGSTEQDEIVFR